MPDPQTTSSVHDELREKTRDVHQRLHRHPILGQLLKPGLVEEVYGRILVAYDSFFQGAEQARSRLECWRAFSLKPCLSALQSDLDGMALGGDKLSPVPFSWIGCPLSCLGSLYALHGSRHGGVFIAKQVASSLPDTPRGFLELGPDQENWHELLNTLATSVKSRSDFERLASGARETFVQLGEWVTRCSPNAVRESDSLLPK